jgi:hypothetical protein
MPGRVIDAVRHKAIEALLTEPSITAAAAVVGVNEKTLRRWLRDDPDFRAGYHEARRRAFDSAVSRLHVAGLKAVQKLIDNLDAEKPADQLRAATGILEFAFRGHEALDVRERLAELERIIRELQDHEPTEPNQQVDGRPVADGAAAPPGTADAPAEGGEPGNNPQGR